MTLPWSDAAGITTSCTVSEKLRDDIPGSFCGDSELLLDRMLEQCQTRPTGRHPGFGRKLIPYFSDETATPLEKAKSKGDGCYVRGASKGGGGYRRNSPRTRRGMSGRGWEDRSRRRVRHCGEEGGVGVTLLSKNEESGEVEYMFQSANVCSLFAGPICFNSPPPEALPMPTAVLLAKAMCLS